MMSDSKETLNNPWKTAFNTKRWRLSVLVISALALIHNAAGFGIVNNAAAIGFVSGVGVTFGAWQLDMVDGVKNH